MFKERKCLGLCPKNFLFTTSFLCIDLMQTALIHPIDREREKKILNDSDFGIGIQKRVNCDYIWGGSKFIKWR